MPSFRITPFLNKKSFVINSILHQKLITDFSTGFVFYRSFPKLARDSLHVIISKEDQNVPDHINHRLDHGFEVASRNRLEPMDLWAISIAMGGALKYAFLAADLGKKKFPTFLKEIIDFYDAKKVKTLRIPFSYEELGRIGTLVDEKAGLPERTLRDMSYRWTFKKGFSRISVEYNCVRDLTFGKLFSLYGYAFFPSHDLWVLSDYSKVFLKIEEQLKHNEILARVFERYSAEESLKYLLGDQVAGLNELLGFTPLDVFELLSRETSYKQVDEAVLRVRRDCKKIRNLFEKVHVSCLKREIDEAIEAKEDLAGIQANQLINYSILDNAGEHMNKRLQDAIHEYIDQMVKDEKASILPKIHKSLKKFKRKSGWISEAKFLTFGTLLILASYGTDSSQVKAMYDWLGKASLSSGAVGVASKIIEEGMKLFPGFNVYASFIDWPKVA
jgi:hypothetical protein